MKMILSSEELFLTQLQWAESCSQALVLLSFLFVFFFVLVQFFVFPQELNTCNLVGISVKGSASSLMGTDFLKCFCSDLSGSLYP